MSGSSDVALDLLVRLATDRVDGALGPLAHYLALYPGHEELVADEYLRATREAAEQMPAGADAEGCIGPYRLIRELGRGGQAVVWLAEDPRLDRRVALKVVQRPPGTEDLSPRFQREARATAGLRHPGVCALYETGAEDSCAWIAMQYVEGRTLAQWLEERAQERGQSLPPTAEDVALVLVWMEKVADALHAAHLSRVVHRDVKPANIMVQDGGEPVVLDFGVALLDEGGPTLTVTGTSLGTPAYMSPEQLGRGTTPVGPASDVWSLGATLYEACTGHRPFAGPTWDALVRAVLHDEPADPRTLSPHVSTDLMAVLQTALCKDVSGRYGSAREFADDLGRLQRGEATAARPLGRVAKVARWSRRNPVVASLSAALVLLMIGAVGITLWKNRALSVANEELVDSNLRLGQKTEEAQQNAERAEREARAKAAALAEYERMADSRRLADARREADALYPIHADLVPRLEEWQRSHAGLIERLSSHEAALARLRERAEPFTEADRLRDYAEELDLARRLRGALTVAHPGKRPELEARILELENETKTQRAWSFGDDVEAQFQHEALTRLTEDLRAFVDPERGVVASIARRIELSKRIRQETVDDRADAWEAVGERLAANPIYHGLELPIQVGLIPLGADPASTLEEFLVWETQPDSIPERGGAGRFEVRTETGIVLVLIPPGAFWMGAQFEDPTQPNYDPRADSYESPVREVALDAYFISKYEMTQAQWLHATGDEPSAYYDGYSTIYFKFPVTLTHPVEQVTWFTCNEELRRLGLTIPTEAQWERAARGGVDTIYAGTSEASELVRFANIAGREVEGIMPNFNPEHVDDYLIHGPVGTFEANPFGLHDMTGNVWEWCRDRFASYMVDPRPGDGERPGFTDNRNYRGGSSGQGTTELRVANRTENNGDLRFNGLGVRPAREIVR